MYHQLKVYCKSILIKIAIIMYLLFIIIYQFNSSTTAYYSSSKIYHGKLSAVDVFQEDDKDNTLEKETDYDTSGTDLKEEVENLTELDEKEINDEGKLIDRVDKHNTNKNEQTHSNQKQESHTQSEQSIEETEENIVDIEDNKETE